MITIKIMRLKHPTVGPKFTSSESKEGDVMPLVRIVDICAQVLGVPKRTVLVEFAVHSGDEILRDGERAGEWTAAEASTLSSNADERSRTHGKA
jgi:hypothetical protein